MRIKHCALLPLIVSFIAVSLLAFDMTDLSVPQPIIAAAASPLPPTQTPYIIVVTATPRPPAPPPPTQTPYIIVVTATPPAPAVPTAATMAALAPAQWPVLFSDNFASNANAWNLGDPQPSVSDFGTTSERISSGKLRIEAKIAKSVNQKYWPIALAALSDLSVSVDAQRVSGTVNAFYSLMFRRNANGHCYLFQVSDDKQFSVWLLQDRWTALINWTPSEVIRPGQVNRLNVTAVGAHLTFSINNQIVASLDNPQLSSGITGVAFEINDPGDAVLEFSNFEVRTPAAALAAAIAPPPVASWTPTVGLPSTPVRPTSSPSASPTPHGITFGPITFAPGATTDLQPVDAATSFPNGITAVYAIFSYEGPINGSQWRFERYLDGKLQPRLGDTGVDLAGSGKTWLRLWSAEGIQSGNWELRLYIMDKLVQRGTYTIQSGKPGAAQFGPIQFAEGTLNDLPLNPHKPLESFKAGTTVVYAFFDAFNMYHEPIWRREWYRDGRLVATGDSAPWSAGVNEKAWWTRYRNDAGLEAGTYELKLYIDDKLAQLATFVIEK